jgi:hypothetical protein
VKREKFHKRTVFLLLCQPSPNCNLCPPEADARAKMVMYLVENGLWALETRKGV